MRNKEHRKVLEIKENELKGVEKGRNVRKEKTRHTLRNTI